MVIKKYFFITENLFVIMAEWKQLITEWLNEYAALQENEIKSFAAEHEHNHEIATTIFNLFYAEEESETATPVTPPTCCSKLQSEPKNEQVNYKFNTYFN